MNRRHFLGLQTLGGLILLSGCTSSDDEPSSDPRDDLDDRTMELADAMGEQISETIGFRRWRFSGDLFIPEYDTAGSPTADVPIISEAYASIVEQGFEYTAMPSAFGEDDLLTYMVYIQPEWASAYSTGDLSEDEYHQQIFETVHGTLEQDE